MTLNNKIEQLIDCSFTFKFHEENIGFDRPTGLARMDDDLLLWQIEPDKDKQLPYYDFDLLVADFKLASLTKNFSSNFEAHFKKLFTDAIYEIDLILSESNNSKIEVLKDIFLVLNEHNKLYVYDQITLLEPTVRKWEILRNLAVKVKFVPVEKNVDNWYYDYRISEYLKTQKYHVENIIKYISTRLEYSNLKFLNKNASRNIKWKATDTDLIELIVALLETNSIVSNDNKISRKELIAEFSAFFGITIKDFESKLTRATERKKDNSPYLTKLKQAFENYCESKLDRQK